MYYDKILDEVLSGNTISAPAFPGGTVSVPVTPGHNARLLGTPTTTTIADFQHDWADEGDEPQHGGMYLSIGGVTGEIIPDLTAATSLEDVAAKVQAAIRSIGEGFGSDELSNAKVTYSDEKFVLESGTWDASTLEAEPVHAEATQSICTLLGWFSWSEQPEYESPSRASATFAVAAGTKYIVSAPTDALTISSVAVDDRESVVLFTAGAIAPTVSYPASLGVIGNIPSWGAEKSYIMGIEGGLMAASEYTPGSAE